jgi:hypothetical protein
MITEALKAVAAALGLGEWVAKIISKNQDEQSGAAKEKVSEQAATVESLARQSTAAANADPSPEATTTALDNHKF